MCWLNRECRDIQPGCYHDRALETRKCWSLERARAEIWRRRLGESIRHGGGCSLRDQNSKCCTDHHEKGVYLCARNVPYLSGRVLVQTSLRYADDKDAIIKQCHSYAQAFKELGVSRDRFAFKLPFTGAAASAALVLNAEGIRTLATTVFSLEQAIAASQSNCLFISPYFNGML